MGCPRSRPRRYRPTVLHRWGRCRPRWPWSRWRQRRRNRRCRCPCNRNDRGWTFRSWWGRRRPGSPSTHHRNHHRRCRSTAWTRSGRHRRCRRSRHCRCLRSPTFPFRWRCRTAWGKHRGCCRWRCRRSRRCRRQPTGCCPRQRHRRRWRPSNRCRGRSSRRRRNRCSQTGLGLSRRWCSGTHLRWWQEADCRRSRRRRCQPIGCRRWGTHLHRWSCPTNRRGLNNRRRLGRHTRFGPGLRSLKR